MTSPHKINGGIFSCGPDRIYRLQVLKLFDVELIYIIPL